MHAQKEVFPLTVMCEVLKVGRSGYYADIQRLKHPKPNKDAVLMESVKRIHQDTAESYGTRRMSQQLRAEGHSVGRDKARTLMKKAKVAVKTKKKFKVLTTDSHHDDPVAPNLLNQNFQVDHSNTVWVGDISVPQQAA